MDTGENPSWQGGGFADRPAGLGSSAGRYDSGLSGPVTPEQRNWAVAAHLSAVLGVWIALGFVGPLVVLLIGAGHSEFSRAHTVEALNFNLSILLYAFIGWVLVHVLIGFLLLPLIGLLWLVGTIMATVKASRGELFRYPLTIRLVH